MNTNFFKISLVLFIFLANFSKSSSSPAGKNLSCFQEEMKNGYLKYRGISFETDKSVRVVSLKLKNKQLKIISKLTPYKKDDKMIKFKIKFIWYGDIFFEQFQINRDTLELVHSANNKKSKLNCRIIVDDFMSEMNKQRDVLQEQLNEEMLENKI